MKMPAIAAVIATSLMLHNMGVSDRVMEGDVHARCNAAHNVEVDTTDEDGVTQPFDLQRRQERTSLTVNVAQTHVGRNGDVYKLVTKPARWEDPSDEGATERWDKLCDTEENRRLTEAIKQLMSEQKSSRRSRQESS